MRTLDRLINRIEMAFVKALIRSVTDSGEIQLVKLEGLAGEVQEGVERLQSYGLTSSPPDGAEALVAYLNGNRDHGVVIVCDSGEFRLVNLKRGEVALYSKFGQKVLLREDGVLEALGDAIELNGADDFVTAFNDLKTAFDTLRDDLNALVIAFNTHPGHYSLATPPDVVPATPATPSSADMSSAKVSTVKVP